MLSFKKLTSDAKSVVVYLLLSYYLRLSTLPTYTFWHGKGAQQEGRGASDRVTPSELTNMLEQRSLDGERELGQRQSKRSKTLGYDFTFTATSEFHQLFAVASREQRHVLLSAHHAAVRYGLDVLEAEAARLERGRGGHTIEPAGLRVACVTEVASRDGGPCIHTHSVVNRRAVSLAEANHWGSVIESELYRHISVAGAAYTMKLGHELSRLGLSLQPRSEERFDSFTIEGVPHALVEASSTRRAVILEHIERKGLPYSPKAADNASLNTRGPKPQFESFAELERRWMSLAAEHNFTPERATALLSNTPRQLQSPAVALQLEAAVEAAVERVTTRRDTFERRHILRRAAEALSHTGIDPALLFDAKEQMLERTTTFCSKEVQPLAERSGGYSIWTTERVLEAAEQATELATASTNDDSHVISAEDVQHRVAASQVESVLKLAAARSSVSCIASRTPEQASATLNALAATYRAKGYQVLGATLTEHAAAKLEKATGIASCSAGRLLATLQPRTATDELKHVGRMFWRVARRKKRRRRTFLPEVNFLHNKTLVVIDGAHRFGVRPLRNLLHEAVASGAKVVLTGDSRVLTPLGRGSIYGHAARDLGEVQPQQDRDVRPAFRLKAERDIEEGRTEQAIGRFGEAGELVEAPTRQEAVRLAAQQLVANYRGRSSALVASPNAFLVAYTPSARRELNTEVQKQRKAARQVGLRSLVGVASVGIGGGHRASIGDRVAIPGGNPSIGVHKGEFGTVESIRFRQKVGPFGRREVVIRLDDKASKGWLSVPRARRVVVPGKAIRGLKLAYALSPDEALDARAKQVHLLHDSAAVESRELLKLSTAVEHLRVFTPPRSREWGRSASAAPKEPSQQRPQQVELER